MRATLMALPATLAVAACASPQEGTVLRFEEVITRCTVTHEVPFASGGMLGVGWDHSVVWRDGADGWTGRKARAIVEPRIGDLVVVRTVWEAVPGTVLSNERESSILRMQRPLYSNCSGSGAWIDGDRIIGVVTHGDRRDPRTVLVQRPMSAPDGAETVRAADGEWTGIGSSP